MPPAQSNYHQDIPAASNDIAKIARGRISPGPVRGRGRAAPAERGLHIVHLALGGCLSAPPVHYGLTEDTGGHIGYILGAAMAQIACAGVGRVEIFTRAFDGFEGRYRAEVEQIVPGCTIHRLTTRNRAYLEKSALAAEVAAYQEAFLEHLARGPRPDVIHAHFADAAGIAAAAAERFGIPWFYTPHSLALDKVAALGTACPDERARIARERAAIAGADAILVSSRDEAERQVLAYDQGAAGRCHRVNPGVMLPPDPGAQAARALIDPLLDDPQKPILLAIARPVRKKNLAALVRAYAATPALQRRANLVILAGQRPVGPASNPVIAEVERLISSHGLDGKVAVPHRHDQVQVRSLYTLAAQGGVFVNPAFNEPFGLTIVEAAQVGVPVVATQVGGPSDILKDLNQGVLVDPTDDAAIAAACLSQLDEPARRRAAEAQERARAQFDWTAYAARSVEILRGLHSARPASPAPSQLFASDIDGTLTGCPEGARGFTQWLHLRPHTRFACVTGRAMGEAQRVLSLWKLPEPDVFITSVGSEIWRRQGTALVLCQDYAGHISTGWQPEAVADLAARLHIRNQPEYERRRWKVSFLGDADQAAALRDLMRAEGVEGHVIASHASFIDVLPHRAGKAAAIRFEAARSGLEERDCIVAGDSGNDRDMLEGFANAIVPANAYAELATLRNPTLYRSAYPYARGVVDGLRALDTEASARIAAE